MIHNYVVYYLRSTSLYPLILDIYSCLSSCRHLHIYIYQNIDIDHLFKHRIIRCKNSMHLKKNYENNKRN